MSRIRDLKYAKHHPNSEITNNNFFFPPKNVALVLCWIFHKTNNNNNRIKKPIIKRHSAAVEHPVQINGTGPVKNVRSRCRDIVSVSRSRVRIQSFRFEKETRLFRSLRRKIGVFSPFEKRSVGSMTTTRVDIHPSIYVLTVPSFLVVTTHGYDLIVWAQCAHRPIVSYEPLYYAGVLAYGCLTDCLEHFNESSTELDSNRSDATATTSARKSVRRLGARVRTFFFLYRFKMATILPTRRFQHDGRVRFTWSYLEPSSRVVARVQEVFFISWHIIYIYLTKR